MRDDLDKLPGDDDLEPKRKGLRRLRKAERALQKKEQQPQPTATSTLAAAAGRNKSTVTTQPATTTTPDKGYSIGGTPTQGRGRQWERRRWKAPGLPDVTCILLAAGRVTAEPAEGGDADKGFNTVLDGINLDAIAAENNAAAGTSGVAVGTGGKGATASRASKGGKKGKGGAKAKEVAAAAGKDGEGEEQAAARRRKEERETDVMGWAEGLRQALEEETFVTTAHRAAVAARDAILSKLADRTKVCPNFVPLPCGSGVLPPLSYRHTRNPWALHSVGRCRCR